MPEEAFAGCPEPEAGLLVQSHTLEDSQTLSIRSRTYLPEIYTPITSVSCRRWAFPGRIPGSRIGGRTTAYSISYGTLFSNLPSSEDAQPASIMTGAFILSSQVFSGYDRFILDGEPTPPPGGQPPRPADIAQDAGLTDLLRRICPKPWRILSGIPLGMI